MVAALFMSSLYLLSSGNPMDVVEKPGQSLQLEISELDDGMLIVALKGNSATTQRVTYELQTSGASSSSHKGSTVLRASSPATLSTIRFATGHKTWCVSLHVTEALGDSYTIQKGSNCSEAM